MKEEERDLSDVHHYMHSTVVDRLDKLEEHYEKLVEPESGILAKTRQSLSEESASGINRVDMKLNCILGFILTSVIGIIITILMKKLGLS
jgi:hypothetical protein